MLRAEGINKIYRHGRKDLQVLHGIGIEVAKGETVALVGPSGAGKSTLLHILGGIDRPSSGKVFLDKQDFYALPDNERAWLRNERIGFVFQFYHLLPEFTALENAMMPALIKGVRVDERARGLLQEFGLSDRLRHRPGELSGGEQQRVAIVRALMNNPEILLCDEPTGNLDSKMGEEILKILFGLNKKKNSTIVIVTHDKEIAKSANRVVEIKDGRIM
ncbi:MAG: ABC transporter ATP-binding protein [Candidatus Omnitrophica bacterium]|nr:ABC transporter ATP-binding protein [Candidatus Omnitrophota bacterium]MBU1852979.1 ABC transporter ATP-binding protein [Candidatus Omnitrophota bacterium]